MQRENIPCPDGMYENCPVFDSEGECYQDEHHDYWPRRDFVRKIEKRFRNLPENKVFICRALHNAIHATTPPPEKPTREEMINALDEHEQRNQPTNNV